MTKGRTKGDKELTGPQRGYVLALSENTDLSNRQIGQKRKCDEKTVRNVRRRAEEAEKENIDPLDNNVITPKPRSGRALILSERDKRQLIRYATKNYYQRRKKWSVIA